MKRPIVPPSFAMPVLTVLTKTAAAAYLPVGISNDRKTLYARGTSTSDTTKHVHALYQSVDDGVTWTLATSAHTVFSTGSDSVQSVLETDDGEILVNVQGSTASPGYLWKSTGWPTSHTTATWTKVLTSVGGYFAPAWSVHAHTFGNDAIVPGSGKFGVVCEYGSQTSVTYASGNSDTTDLGKARRVYFTTDYGATWTMVFDLAAFFPAGVGLHCHAVAWDPFWDRIWLTWGDTQTNTVGAGNMELLYSDDKGATWTAVPALTNADGAQSTSIAILPDCIVLGSDNGPGLLRIPRTGYRTIGVPQYPIRQQLGTGAFMIAQGFHRNRKHIGAPLLMAYQGFGSNYRGTIHYSGDGASFTEMFRDTVAGSRCGVVFGPTLSGIVVFNLDGALMRAQMEEPGAGLMPRLASFAGDGATTTYTIAHRLAVTPTRLYGFDQTANAGTYTLTADATNIMVTFAAAPANGAVVSLELRYA